MENQINNEATFKKMFPFFDCVRTVPKITEYCPPQPPVIPQSSLDNAKLSFKELLDYKTFRCENPQCPHNPRTTVANNQYLETELRCHGYHHAKDFRRPPVKDMSTFTGEFEYQANYYKDGRCPLAKDKYSQNFFESLYHPLYYKQFACKRAYCDQTKYCPYFHSEREKMEWELHFEQNLKVNRKVFLSTKTRQTQDTGFKTPGSPSAESEYAPRSPLSAKSSRRLESKGAAYERPNIQLSFDRPTTQMTATEDNYLFTPFKQYAGYEHLLNFGKSYLPSIAGQF
jgi:hypothetical protein